MIYSIDFPQLCLLKVNHLLLDGKFNSLLYICSALGIIYFVRFPHPLLGHPECYGSLSQGTCICKKGNLDTLILLLTHMGSERKPELTEEAHTQLQQELNP